MRAALTAPAGRLLMEYALSLLVAIGLGVYLFYALLKPERF
jgi:K+-transporting ATPase KdpF subunit